jgi:hypothetical protein
MIHGHTIWSGRVNLYGTLHEGESESYESMRKQVHNIKDEKPAKSSKKVKGWWKMLIQIAIDPVIGLQPKGCHSNDGMGKMIGKGKNLNYDEGRHCKFYW